MNESLESLLAHFCIKKKNVLSSIMKVLFSLFQQFDFCKYSELFFFDSSYIFY